MMNIFIRVIPFIELFLILAMLGLVVLGYLSLQSRTNQPDQNQHGFAEKWVLPGLMGLAILAIVLLLMVAFSQG